MPSWCSAYKNEPHTHTVINALATHILKDFQISFKLTVENITFRELQYKPKQFCISRCFQFYDHVNKMLHRPYVTSH